MPQPAGADVQSRTPAAQLQRISRTFIHTLQISRKYINSISGRSHKSQCSKEGNKQYLDSSNGSCFLIKVPTKLMCKSLCTYPLQADHKNPKNPSTKTIDAYESDDPDQRLAKQHRHVVDGQPEALWTRWLQREARRKRRTWEGLSNATPSPKLLNKSFQSESTERGAFESQSGVEK